MKAFIDRIFKARKEKKIKAALQEAEKFVQEKVKKEKHIDCECKECIKRIKRNAKRIKEAA